MASIENIEQLWDAELRLEQWYAELHRRQRRQRNFIRASAGCIVFGAMFWAAVIWRLMQ